MTRAIFISQQLEENQKIQANYPTVLVARAPGGLISLDNGGDFFIQRRCNRRQRRAGMMLEHHTGPKPTTNLTRRLVMSLTHATTKDSSTTDESFTTSEIIREALILILGMLTLVPVAFILWGLS